MSERPQDSFESHPDYQPEPDYFDDGEQPGDEDASPEPAEGDAGKTPS
jgi:hypothetical protein